MKHDELLSLIDYNRETGEIRLKVDSTKKRAGDIAGDVNIHGYKRLHLKGRRYLAHRVAWFYVTGDWPSGIIDHIDRNPTNNAWSNLRLATKSQNAANMLRRIGISGAKGVYPQRNGRWQAKITINGVVSCLGTYDTVQAASDAYFAASQSAFGEFARR